MRFVVAAGGTGGHIYPALALSRFLTDVYANVEIVWIGGRGRLEQRLLKNEPYRLVSSTTRSFPRR